MAERTDASPQTKRKRLPSAERKADFIEKAIQFFADEGFESSTRGLARRLGVTQPLLYRYFPSKDDLISEVYDAVYVNRWRPEWETLLRDRTRSVKQRLNDFYNVYTDVIFNREWMRIYLFSGLKGVDINRRYMVLAHLPREKVRYLPGVARRILKHAPLLLERKPQIVRLHAH